jgi:hypothetical protein
MTSDNAQYFNYGDLMATEPAHIILNIDTKWPIEIGDFVSAFSSISHQYEKFIRDNYPSIKPDAQMYVREVRQGSIEVDIIPWVIGVIPAVAGSMEHVLIIDHFIRTYCSKISSYFKPNGRDIEATRNDLKDFTGAVAAIAKDPEASATIQAAYYEDGEKKIKAAFKFDTSQARHAQEQIENHKRELERDSSSEHERVLMAFRQCNVRDIVVGKKSGETVIIEDISPTEFPLIYASALAESRIKHEIREAKDNVFKKGFVVDVNVQLKGGRAVAYRVTDIHQVIDLPDDDQPSQ